jgi:acyl carrier protein
MAATNEVADRVRKVIADHLGVEAETVVDTADLRSDLGADSLDIVELIMRCEEEFGVEIPDDDMDEAWTVADLVKIVKGRIG